MQADFGNLIGRKVRIFPHDEATPPFSAIVVAASVNQTGTIWIYCQEMTDGEVYRVELEEVDIIG